MKKMVPYVLAAVVAFAGGVARASWTYDPSEGTLTDGVWTLHATLVKNTTDQLNVSGQKGSFNGTDPCPIDLTEIYDSSNNRYYAVSFACFNSSSGAWNEAKKKRIDAQPLQGQTDTVHRARLSYSIRVRMLYELHGADHGAVERDGDELCR